MHALQDLGEGLPLGLARPALCDLAKTPGNGRPRPCSVPIPLAPATSAALQRLRGERGTVDLDEGLVATGGRGVNAAGDEILPTPVSPLSRTVMSVSAMPSMTRRTARICELPSSESGGGRDGRAPSG